MSARDNYKPRRFKQEGKPRHENKKLRVAKHFGKRGLTEDKIEQLDEILEKELSEDIPELGSDSKRREPESSYDFRSMPDPDWDKMIPMSKDIEVAKEQEKADKTAKLNAKSASAEAAADKADSQLNKTEENSTDTEKMQAESDKVKSESFDAEAVQAEPEKVKEAKTEPAKKEESRAEEASESSEKPEKPEKTAAESTEENIASDTENSEISEETEADESAESDKNADSNADAESDEKAEEKAETADEKSADTDESTEKEALENGEEKAKKAKRTPAPKEKLTPEEKAKRAAKMQKAFADDFEYVTPAVTYKEKMKSMRKHKKVKSHHSGTTKTVSDEQLLAESEGYVFPVHRQHHHHHHHHHGHHRSWWKRRARWQRALMIVAAVILALVIVLGSAYYIFYQIGYNSMHDYSNLDIQTPTADESGNDILMVDKGGRVITYDGVSYEFNDDVMSVTLIGTDDGSDEFDGLHMSDAIYIVAIDSKTGKVTILGISRDTMADVDLYSDEGTYIDTEKMQIAYTYAYGNSKVSGGQNTLTSLQRLFYGLPLDNYFAINLQALTTLNDTIGGVTLTSSITFTSPVDGRTINAGDTVTLHGKEANTYVRTRDINELESNNDRMQRQQEYIIGFLNSVIPAARKDLSIVSKVYDEIEVNSDTNLDLAEMTYLASTAVTTVRTASDVNYVNLVGEITEGEHAEMNLSDEQIIRTMLDIFYKPLAAVPDMNN